MKKLDRLLISLFMLVVLNVNGQNNLLPASGNVGVGTTNPQARLHVKGETRFERASGGNNYVMISGASDGNYITADDPGTNHKHLVIRVAPTNDNATDRHLLFQTGKVNGVFQTRLYIGGNGNVGIGTSNPKEKLSVNGNIRAKEIKVETANWPDYVFHQDHELTPLKDLKQFIKENGHLPEVPKAKEIEESGLSLGEMNKILMKKIEELTLYLLEKESEMDEMRERLLQLEQDK